MQIEQEKKDLDKTNIFFAKSFNILIDNNKITSGSKITTLNHD